MKCTGYFKNTRMRPDRRDIKMEWIERACKNPVKEQKQSDGRIRRWIWIPEARKYLRVVLLSDGETLHNAFFDRDFVESQHED